LDLKSLVIARPSLLHGDRQALNQPKRRTETFALCLLRALRAVIPANYRAISAKDVAHALLKNVQMGKLGVITLQSADMQPKP